MDTKHIVTLLFAEPHRAQQLSARLSSVRIDAVVAHNSEDLYQLLNRQRVDLVLIEQQLGGFLTGLEIIERLRAALLHPVTLLLAEPHDRLCDAARRLGVEKVLSPRVGVDEIVQQVEQLLAVGKTPSVIVPFQARKLVQQLDEIRPLPQLLVKLASYLRMDARDVPVRELAKDISVDPKATTQLLKLVNSSSLGVTHRIVGTLDAINLLGVKRTIALVLSAAAVSAQSDLLKDWSEPQRNWYYQRSVLIASTAAAFAQRLEDVSASTAFVLGLLQDIGVLVMAKAFGERYTRIIQRVRTIPQVQLHFNEYVDFQMTHAEVSAALLQKWGLPESIIGPILEHHDSEDATEKSQTEQRFARVMRIGEGLANLLDLRSPIRLQYLNRLLTTYGDRYGNQTKLCIEEAIAKAAESSGLLSLPAPNPATLRHIVRDIISATLAEEMKAG